MECCWSGRERIRKLIRVLGFQRYGSVGFDVGFPGIFPLKFISGSKRVRKGYPRTMSPVDLVTCRELRIVSSPSFRYTRAKWVMERTLPEETRTDSGFLSLCRGHLRCFVREHEITLPPAPESMRAVHGCPRTSSGIVSNGDTRLIGHSWSWKFV